MIAMTLRTRLLLLVLAVLLPTAGLFVWIVAATYLRETESAHQRLRETTHSLALLVDREFDKRAAIARTLGTSAAITQGDWRRFYDEAKAATKDSGDWVVLVDHDDQLLNTSVPFGTPLPKRTWTPDRPLAAGTPQVSNLRIGPVTKKPILAVFAAESSFTPTRYNVGIVFTPAALQALMNDQRLPAGWVAAVIDREKTVVARTPAPERWIGQPVQPPLAQALSAQPEGFIESVPLDGVDSLAFFSRSPQHGWAFVIGVPRDALAAAARRAAWESAIAASLLGAFALCLALLAARAIKRPIEDLQRDARQLENKQVPPLRRSGLAEADAVSETLHHAGLHAAQVNEELERRIGEAVAQANAATERAAELQRVLAEELLHLITDNLPVLISYIDHDLRYRLNNKAYEAWIGKPREQITGQRVRDMVDDAAWKVLEPHMRAALAGQTVSCIEYLHYPKLGPRWVELFYVPHRGPGGEVRGVALMVHDITAQTLANEALRQNQASLERIAEAQRLVVALHDATRGLRDPAQVQAAVVSRIGRHFGVSRCLFGEVDVSQQFVDVGREYAEGVGSVLGHHRLADYGPAIVQELKAARTVVIDDVRADPRTNDTAIAAAFTAVEVRSLICVPLVKERRFVALLVLTHHEPRAWSRDDATLLEQIAERTWFSVANARAEAALRESRDVLALAMRGGRMGAWSRDLATEAVWWSRELEEIFGLPPGGFAGTTPGFRSLVHPDDRPQLDNAVKQALHGQQEYAVEFRFRHADGDWHWMEGRGRAVYAADGRPSMLYGLGVDITQRKQAEEELRRLNAELFEADRRKDEFLATLAHELRNPLAPITHALEVLRLKDPADADTRWTRDIIDRQVRQLTRLVDDLLDLARITRGKVQLQRERIDLGVVLHGALEAARPLIDSLKHAVTLELPSEPLWLDADAMRLTQVVLNLLNNAAKYTPAGGEIRVWAERAGGEALIGVRDSGIGIATEHLHSVFEMFSQIAPALERSQGGLGIGLALARGLVDLHGGRIEAHSDGVGSGSEFIVHLPLAESSAALGPTAAPAPEASASATRRVLVVDDNRDAADSLALMLTLSGHDTRAAHGGYAALELAAQFLPDIVLLDIGMPQLNGYEVAERMRLEPWGRRIVLVALTGWGQEEDKRRALAAGFDHHLTKPVDPQRLAALLEVGPGG
jgi:PAS domain S-box-containing protein